MKITHRWSGEWTQMGAIGVHDLFTLNGEWDDILYIPVGAEGWADSANAFNLSTQEFEIIPQHWEVFKVDLDRSRANWSEEG